MNKITVKNLMCSVVYGISLLLFVSGIMCIVNYAKLERPANGLLLCFIFCCFVFVLAYAIRDKYRYSSLEKLDEAYSDVKNTDRTKILFSLAAMLTMLYFSLALSYYDVSVYDTRYPDAVNYFTEDVGVDANTLAFIKSMPTWISEPLWCNAQTVHDVELLTRTGVDMESTEVTAVLDKMDSVKSRVNTMRMLAIIMLVIFGYFYNYSQRTRIYIERRKEILKNESVCKKRRCS